LVVVCHASWYRVYTGTDTRMDSILFGSIMAIAVNPVIDKLDSVSKRASTVAALIGAAVLIASIALRGELFRQTARYTIQGLALFPVFFFILRYKESVVTRFLEWRIFRHLAGLSYGLYVLHYTVLAVVKSRLGTGPVATLVLTFSGSYGLALIVRRLVEIPCHRMRNRILSTPHRAAAGPKAAIVVSC